MKKTTEEQIEETEEQIEEKMKHFKPTLKLRMKNYLEERNFWKYPLFISYPRSGSHWINCVMELYFDRPRLRKGRQTFLDKNRDDWMWIFDHDIDLKVLNKIEKKGEHPKGKILYLVRNSSDVIKSYKKFRRDFYNLNTLDKEIFCEHFRHKNRYLNNSFVVVIKYERFLDKKTRADEFKKVCDFFGKTFDRKRIESIFNLLAKIKIEPTGLSKR